MLFAQTTDNSLTPAVTEYRAVYLTARGLARRTRVGYGHDVAELVTFLKSPCGLTSPRQIDKRHLDLYLAELDRLPYTAETRRRRFAALRSFCRFLFGRRYVPADPSERLAPLPSEPPRPRILSRVECQRLRQALRLSDRDSTWRDDALIELLLGTGITLSETAALTCAAVHLPERHGAYFTTAGRLHVMGTGAQERMLTLPAEACTAINRYLTIRPRVSDPHLFITRFGHGMQPRAIERAVEKYFEDAGISGASVRTLRHTFAVHLVRREPNLDVVRQIMGLDRVRQLVPYTHYPSND
jgi:integrase/recombinase XerD